MCAPPRVRLVLLGGKETCPLVGERVDGPADRTYLGGPGGLLRPGVAVAGSDGVDMTAQPGQWQDGTARGADRRDRSEDCGYRDQGEEQPEHRPTYVPVALLQARGLASQPPVHGLGRRQEPFERLPCRLCVPGAPQHA